MADILVTAFEPFGGDSVNPTMQVLEALPGSIGDFNISKLLLCVEFERARQTLREAVQSIKPKAVLSLGLAAGRSAVSVERVAVNLMDARIADNAGYMPQDIPLCEGPAAYFSTLPTRQIYEEIKRKGIPVELSYTAGTYVCNALMYTAIALAQPAGFIHIPMAADYSYEAVYTALVYIAEWLKDK